MKLYSRYIGYVYLKYLFILFIALELFYVGIDVLTNLKDLPQSANLQLLYLGFTALSAIGYTLPLSLIFAMIITKFNMIRSNELISFYSLGISRNAIIKVPFFIALAISLLYIYLNSTPFAYVNEYKNNLSSFNAVGKVSSGMFLKYGDKYIYVKELNSLANAAKDIKIFYLKNGDLTKLTDVKTATYNAKKWTFYDVNSTTIPSNLAIGNDGLKYEFSTKFEDLAGFDPTSIEKIYDSSNIYSIKDALNSIKTFKNQGVNIDGIKANLYSLIFTPLFAPLMVLILYYYLPASGRFFNLALLSFGFFIVTLSLWGVLFVMTRFALSGVIIPEVGIILPIILLFCYACYLVLKHR
ncbi:LptF/LptG family permease [Campylobacter geochelonis]|uniref:Permease YjgP/YjgQ n=1 Tax=Campylobacter geochelonis TaxID=1780362 RepID=A0A128EMW7_9BACT|nr:LptF/LptG family permease [Campylobacter geochelonis]QKF70625.1 lipooligosaccharide transport system, ABC transporter permease component LptG [Campylobacter geochelonis]CZE45907.1 permease YjgP/YjgQ [Campylobacter geochelonis]CZE46731.1 permease YjgP/YjgQ [Campylobacter geochelonis]CZE50332.1 permease YjgP/YjgQ [Campylobacter geochelonis]